jgi:hypothetical protein
MAREDDRSAVAEVSEYQAQGALIYVAIYCERTDGETARRLADLRHEHYALAPRADRRQILRRAENGRADHAFGIGHPTGVQQGQSGSSLAVSGDSGPRAHSGLRFAWRPRSAQSTPVGHSMRTQDPAPL